MSDYRINQFQNMENFVHSTLPQFTQLDKQVSNIGAYVNKVFVQ